MQTPMSTTISVDANSTGLAGMYAQQCLFQKNIKKTYRSQIEVVIEAVFVDFLDELIRLIDLPLEELKSFHDGVAIIFDKAVIKIENQRGVFDRHKLDMSVVVYGELNVVRKIHENITKKYDTPKDANLSWSFMTDRGTVSKNVPLAIKNVPHDCFYPWIKPGISSFLQSFMDSDSSLLLLLGEPGTGKTTLIRDFIHRYRLSTKVTYDEELMKTDQFFADFIIGDYELLVLEDADVLMRDRSNGNRVMNKLLNISDGLIPVEKKILMTANITDLNEIDPALIRPGRCFETLMFRALSQSEAHKVATTIGLQEPDGPKTLSELFATGPTTKPKSSMGFTMP